MIETMQFVNNHYFKKIEDNTLLIHDHLGGFDKNLESDALNCAVQFAKEKNISTIVTGYVFSDYFSRRYGINFNYRQDLVGGNGWEELTAYTRQPGINYKNFICSFNGSNHVSRQLLSSILKNQGYFDPYYSSKNFTGSNDKIIGHLNNLDLTEDEIELYDKFFKNTDEFNDTVYSFGHVRFDHSNNIYNLESKLTQSFVHIVSETMATSYYPFVTEKFLYSIVTRGLFVAYAQPGWHTHIEKYYGFKLYDKIFDYSFDSIQNPVKRLIKLIEMISKFSKLSVDDWRDLYFVLENDTIEYNYNHYFSGNYLEHLKQFDTVNN